MSFIAAPTGHPECSPWRWPAAALALTIAAAHVPVTAEHLAEAPYIGYSFIALEVAAVALALLLLRDTALAWAAAAVLPVLAILAYAVTRAVALPQIGDDVGHWTEPLGIVALTAEALLALLALDHRGLRWPSQRTANASVATAGILLVLGLVATGGYAAHVNGAA